MSITFSKPPKTVLQAGASEMRALLESDGDIGGGEGDAKPTAHALPLYSVPITTLAEAGSQALPQATQQGWRMIMDVSGSTKLVDSIDDVIVSISGGKALANLVKAGEMAAAVLPKGINFEPRVLDLGRLGKSALWCHAPDPAIADRFFSLGAEPHEITEDAFITDAAERARIRIAAIKGQDDGPRTASEVPPSDVGG